ncbi:hypothetical protein LY78DRAFT_229821 [Colletotrichum sublineola]|nr:hypothetical protein LY78DRAFT_229821 [Colletotrichum sublineola]
MVLLSKAKRALSRYLPRYLVHWDRSGTVSLFSPSQPHSKHAMRRTCVSSGHLYITGMAYTPSTPSCTPRQLPAPPRRATLFFPSGASHGMGTEQSGDYPLVPYHSRCRWN